MGKKTLRFLLWTAVGVIVLLIVAVIAARVLIPAEKIRQLAQEQGSRLTGSEVSIGAIDISFWGGLGLRLVDVTIDSPLPGDTGLLLSADNIDLKMRLLPLLKGRFQVDRLVVNRPFIRLVKDKRGRVNYRLRGLDSLSAGSQPAPEPASAALALSFDVFELDDGILYYRDDSSRKQWQCYGVRVSTTLENPLPGQYESRGELHLDSLSAESILTGPPAEINLTYQAAFSVSNQRLSIQDALLELDGIRTRVTLVLDSVLSAPRGHGNVIGEQLTLSRLANVLSPYVGEVPVDVAGGCDLDIDFQIDSNRPDSLFTYRGNVLLSDLSIVFPGVSDTLRIRRAPFDIMTNGLRTNIEGGSFGKRPFKAHLVLDDFSDPGVNAEVRGSLDLSHVQVLFPDTGSYRVSGIASLDLKCSGKLKLWEQLQYSGDIAVEQGSLHSEKLFEPISALRVKAYVDNKLLRVRELEASFPSGELSFTGTIEHFAEYFLAEAGDTGRASARIDGRVIGETGLSVLNDLLWPGTGRAIGGDAQFNLRISGALADPASFRPWGSVEVHNGSYRDPELPEQVQSLETELTLVSDTVIIQRMDVTSSSSDLSLQGKLIEVYGLLPSTRRPSSARRPFLTFSLSSHRLNLDKLFPEAVPGRADSNSASGIDSLPLFFWPDLDGEGGFQIDSLWYAEVPFSEASGDIIISGRKITCQNVKSSVYSGRVKGSTTIDLTDFATPGFKGEFQAQQVEVNKIVSRFSPWSSVVFGKGDLSGEYEGVGLDRDQFLQSLTMQGKGYLKDGKIVTSGSLYNVLKPLVSVSGNKLAKEQSLKSLQTMIRVEKGRVYLNDFKTHVPGVGDLIIGGYYGFDGRLDYRGTIALTAETAERLTSGSNVLSGLASLLTNKQSNRITLPIEITGSIQAPSVSIDYSVIGQAGKDKLKNKAEGLLRGLIKSKDK